MFHVVGMLVEIQRRILTLSICSCNVYRIPSVYPLLHIIYYIHSVSQSVNLEIMYQYRGRPGARFRKARWTVVAAM